MVFPDSESCSGSDGQQITKQWPCPFFRVSLALGSALELLLSPTITSCHIQYTFHCTLQSNWEVVHCSCIESLQNTDFFLSAYEIPSKPSFFTFPICFKCWTTIKWPMLSSLATSYVVLRGLASMILSIGHWSTSDSWPLSSSSPRLLSPLQNFLNNHCTVHSLSVPWPNALLMLQVVSDVLEHIFNSNKKIIQMCFLCNIVSLV